MTGRELSFPVPMRVWLAPRMDPKVGAELARLLRLEARVCHDDIHANEAGPAIVILSPDDLGPGEEAARALLKRATPGRPVLYGGTEDRDILLAAINTWRVLRAVPTGAPIPLLCEAARAAQERLDLDISLEMTATTLRRETERLENAVQELDRTRADLLHTERLTTIGRLTTGLSSALEEHQHTLDVFEGLLAQAAGDPSLENLLRSAHEGVNGIGALLAEIQAYAHGRPRKHDPKPESLDEVVSRTVSFARFDELMSGRTLRTALTSSAKINGDRHALYHVLLNLIRNALQATKDGGFVEVRTFRSGEWACVEVEDNGTGMSVEVRQRMFEPFFSTKADAGLGLGLQTARTVVERHGGKLTVNSRERHGTRLTLSLPAIA